MLYYIARRILQGFFVLVMVLIFTFTLPYFLPHGALNAAYFTCAEHLTPACINGFAARYGLNQPYWTRLWHYLWGIFIHGNLGLSFKDSPPQITGILKLYIPRTFFLALSAFVLATIIAIPLGIYQAWQRNRPSDYWFTGGTFMLYATPPFVLGFLLLDAFSIHTFHLPDSPTVGVHPWAIFTDPKGFILPVLTLTALQIGSYSRYMRSNVIDVLVQDYIRTARAKGCSPRQILIRHTFRNAMTSIVTILGLSIPTLLAGAVITESVFNYPGLGLIVVNAAVNFDTQVVLGVTVVVTAMTVLGNLIADLSLVLINPRIRITGSDR
ncbi:MAG: ABC transporter permease [Acidimicrobiales bacterium]